jgi:hypothetical protein
MSAHPVLPENDVLALLDRPRLCQLLEEASAACFPQAELIGNAPQRDFYFRRLLRKVIENTRLSGLPVVGGTREELHAFICNAEPDWRRETTHVRPYQLNSVKGLLSHWKSTFCQTARTHASKYGSVRFFYVPATATAPDTVLGAEVTDFVTSSGRRIDVPAITNLPDAARLTSMLSDSAAASVSAHKTAVVDRHVRQVFGRGEFAGLYQEKLLRKTLTEIGQHIRDYNRAMLSGNAPSAWTIVTAVLLGWLWYSAAATPRFTPTYTVKNHQASLSNIVGNSEGQIAEVSEDGKQLTPWVNRVENPNTGAYASLVPDGKGGYHFELRGPYDIVFETPPSWKMADDDAPLPTEIEWTTAPCSKQSIIFSVWLDTRAYLPASKSDLPPFTLAIEPRGATVDSFSREELAPSHISRFAPSDPRYRLTWEYRFPGPGDYDVILVYSPDAYEVATGSWRRTETSARQLVQLQVPKTGAPVERTANHEGDRATPIDGAFQANFCISGDGREYAQLTIAFLSDGRPFGLVISPDRDTWPPYAELVKAAYAIKIDRSMWIQKEDIRVERTPTGHYYFLVPMPFKDKRYFEAELHGSYDGVSLPPSKPVGIAFNGNVATLIPRDAGAYATSCGTVTWEADYAATLSPRTAPPAQPTVANASAPATAAR